MLKVKTTRSGRKLHLASVGSTRSNCGVYVYENVLGLPPAETCHQAAEDARAKYPETPLCEKCFGIHAFDRAATREDVLDIEVDDPAGFLSEYDALYED